MKIIKSILLNVLTGVSVATVLLLLLVGYSDRIDPEDHHLLACLGMFLPFAVIANLLFIPIWIIFKWKRVWIPIAGLMLAYAPIRTYFPINFNADKEPPAEGITVVSYNVCGFGCNFKYEQAADTVVGYLKRIDADIVCLQEDKDGKGKGGFEKMQQLYPYNDTIHFSNDVVFNAIGIHTRYPIIRKERLPIVSRANGAIAYFLQVEADTVIVIKK